jgi:hypothetical protein
MASAVQFRLSETCEEVLQLRRVGAKIEHKARALKAEKKALEQEREDLIIKAGWAAEQLQELQHELEFERSKHVKQSRLTVVKQAEELAKTKKENDALKKQLQQAGANALAQQAGASKKKKPDASYKTESKHVAPGPVEPYVAPAVKGFAQILGEGALGQNTIAELVALKANQRAERAVKLDELIKKNRESRDMRKSLDGGADTLHKLMRNALGSRRGLLGGELEEDDIEDSLSLSGDESEEEVDWS